MSDDETPRTCRNCGRLHTNNSERCTICEAREALRDTLGLNEEQVERVIRLIEAYNALPHQAPRLELIDGGKNNG